MQSYSDIARCPKRAFGTRVDPGHLGIGGICTGGETINLEQIRVFVVSLSVSPRIYRCSVRHVCGVILEWSWILFRGKYILGHAEKLSGVETLELTNTVYPELHILKYILPSTMQRLDKSSWVLYE